MDLQRLTFRDPSEYEDLEDEQLLREIHDLPQGTYSEYLAAREWKKRQDAMFVNRLNTITACTDHRGDVLSLAQLAANTLKTCDERMGHEIERYNTVVDSTIYDESDLTVKIACEGSTDKRTKKLSLIRERKDIACAARDHVRVSRTGLRTGIRRLPDSRKLRTCIRKAFSRSDMFE